MTPEEIKKIVDSRIAEILGGDRRFVFQTDIKIFDKNDIQVGKSIGTKIGTEATQKIGFFGATPRVQVSAIASPTGAGDAGVDTPARNAIQLIINALQALGLTA